MKDSFFYNLPSCGSDTVNQEAVSYRNSTLEGNNKNSPCTVDPYYVEVHKSRKITFKKVIKFFKEVIRPILTFIPLYISALASYKRATSVAC